MNVVAQILVDKETAVQKQKKRRKSFVLLRTDYCGKKKVLCHVRSNLRSSVCRHHKDFVVLLLFFSPKSLLGNQYDFSLPPVQHYLPPFVFFFHSFFYYKFFFFFCCLVSGLLLVNFVAVVLLFLAAPCHVSLKSLAPLLEMVHLHNARSVQ